MTKHLLTATGWKLPPLTHCALQSQTKSSSISTHFYVSFLCYDSLLVNQWRCLLCISFAQAVESDMWFMQTASHWNLTISHLFPYSPSLVQPLSPAGGFSQGHGGCAPCQNGAGPGMPLFPGTPVVFPPLEVLPSQPTAAYAVHGQPGVLHRHLTTALPNLKSSGKRQTPRCVLGKWYWLMSCRYRVAPRCWNTWDKRFLLIKIWSDNFSWSSNSILDLCILQMDLCLYVFWLAFQNIHPYSYPYSFIPSLKNASPGRVIWRIWRNGESFCVL